MRRSLPTRLGLVLLLLGGAPALAQNMPVPDGKGRLLQLFDLDAIRAPAQDEAEVAPAAGAGPPRAVTPLVAEGPWEKSVTVETAEFVRRFVEPPLGPGDDLQILGQRWLALLGSPAQIASAEKVLAAAAAHRHRAVEVDVQVIQLAKDAFAPKVSDLLRAGQQGTQARWELVMKAEDATKLIATATAAGGERLESPRLAVMPLQRATLMVANQTSYVKDFEVTRNGDSVVADPVIGVVTDGLRADVVATFLEPDLIAVGIDVQIQQLQRPIAEFKTTIANGVPVTIQLPQVTGVRFQQVSRIQTRDRVVFAAQRVDGNYLLTIVGAEPGPETPK